MERFLVEIRAVDVDLENVGFTFNVYKFQTVVYRNLNFII